MSLILRKPTSPARRHMTVPDFAELTTNKPVKKLTVRLKRHAGRDATGQISIRHRGGGSKRQYRLVDFRLTDRLGDMATVRTIEYDPNRSARIALIEYADQEKRYIIAPAGLSVGMEIVTAETGEAQVGNRLPLSAIPTGVAIHNLELEPDRGGKLVRSAGQSATLLAKEGEYGLVRLPSGEVRRIHLRCFATIGAVSFPEHKTIRYAKAGRRRNMGWRPTVRGKAMNVNDHPHGGGEGRSPIGLKNPKTPWGKPALGVRTRRNKRSDRFIVNRRKRK
ncbi:MAG: 50S ribosomal protein L2 [Patescibacteria group bacterium]